MLSPVREDTLGFHAKQLKWMGYPFAILLVINLTCVLYGVSRTGPERELPARSVAAVGSERAYIPGDVFSPDVDSQPEPAFDPVRLAGQATQVVEEVKPPEMQSERMETPSSPPASAQALGWFSGWANRAAASQTDTHLYERLDDDAIKPEIAAQSPETGAPRAKDSKDPGLAAEPAAEARSPSPAVADHETGPVEHTGLLIRNPNSNQGAVFFLADDRQIGLKPGESKFIGKGRHTIRFHRGGRFGSATHLLSDGQYYFTVTKDGWTLLGDETSDAR